MVAATRVAFERLANFQSISSRELAQSKDKWPQQDPVGNGTMSASIDAKAFSLLFKAIEAADCETLKHVLKSMCRVSTKCSATAARFLLIRKGRLLLDDELQEGVGEDDDNDDVGEDEDEDKEEKNEAKQARTTKRRKFNHKFSGVDAELISRYETCAVCKKRFDLMTNNPEACQTHDGDLEIDEDNDGWAEDDEYRHAPNGINPDTDWRRVDFPDMFKWNCCDGNARAKPCQISRHVVKVITDCKSL